METGYAKLEWIHSTDPRHPQYGIPWMGHVLIDSTPEGALTKHTNGMNQKTAALAARFDQRKAAR